MSETQLIMILQSDLPRQVLPVLLSKLGPWQSTKSSGYTSLPWQLVLDTMSDMFLSMAKFTSRDHTAVVWTALQVRLHFNSNLNLKPDSEISACVRLVAKFKFQIQINYRNVSLCII